MVFLNPEGSAWCCPVGAQSGSKDTGAPGKTYMAALGERSSREGERHQTHGAAFPATSLLQFLSPSQLGAKGAV